jgi:hypothetical protein
MNSLKINPKILIERIEASVNGNAERVLTRLGDYTPDIVRLNDKKVSPFYNKFLPKILQRETHYTFYPNTEIVKSRFTYNGNKQITKVELFNNEAKPIYLETYNPLTQNSFVRIIKDDGSREEKTFIENVLVLNKKYNSDGELTYREKFNPKTQHRVTEEFSPKSYILTERIETKD